MFRVLTELTVLAHLLFILFVIGGGFVARRRWWLTMVHLGAVLWAVYAEIASGVVCPLTSLENYFALRAGLATYKADFITRYLVPVIYQDGLAPTLQYVLVVLVVVITVIAYATKPRKKSRLQAVLSEREVKEEASSVS